MSGPHANSPRRCIVIARTDDRFASFSPYVPAIDERGEVAFQATLAGGGTGVYSGLNGQIRTLVEWPAHHPLRVVSHPDINAQGMACFYAQGADGPATLLVLRDGTPVQIAQRCGPLGPTMNERGQVAFRDTDAQGRACIRFWTGARADVIASESPETRGFEGLPVVDRNGGVAFRATRTDGAHEICLWAGTTARVLAQTGTHLAELSRFPCLNDAGRVAFCAIDRDGVPAVMIAHRGGVERAPVGGERFDSLRGVLIDAQGGPVVIGTRRAGTLGVHAGSMLEDTLLALGAPLLGSSVSDFALNPVSINAAGQLAVRVALADRREFILRFDAPGPGSAPMERPD